MKKFDRYLRTLAAQEDSEIPYAARKRIASFLASLPERTVYVPRRMERIAGKAAWAAACFALCTLVLLPNLSPAYAQAAERIPVLGSLIRVVTIRNYFYEDDSHEMSINVPAVEVEAAEGINRDIESWTSELVRQFYEELEVTGGSGYGSVSVEYEPVTDTEVWFTLKLSVCEIAAGSNTYFKYYHLDKRTGETVVLGDLFIDDSYREVLAEDIRRQMREQMDAEEEAVYWLDTSDPAFSFGAAFLTEDHNFSFTGDGELEIPFDKYEVAPGYMGCPAFTISSEVTEKILREEYVNVP